MTGSERGDLPQPPVPPRDQPPDEPATVRLPGRVDEFDTAPQTATQPVVAIPAVPPPRRPQPPPMTRPPRLPPPRRRPRRIVVSVPNWVLGGLALLAAVAGLLFLPALSPWARAPAESPLEDTDPGVGVIGSGVPGIPDASGPAADPGGGAGPSAAVSPTATGGSGPPTPTGPDGQDTTTGTVPAPQITGFATRPLVGGLIGYEIDLSVSNTAGVAQTWDNASAYITGVPLGVRVLPPATGLRAILASGRVCVEPTDEATRNLDPDESQQITLELTMVSLGQAPRQGTLNDGQCPASAQS